MSGFSDFSTRKFAPCLTNCRSRKNSTLRPRLDSSSSTEETSSFALKNYDFYFPRSPQPRKRAQSEQQDEAQPSDFCLKNKAFYFGEGAVCEDVAMEEENHLEDAQAFAARHQGECLSSTCEDPHLPLLYKCKLGHLWESDRVLLYGEWCAVCEKLLQKAKTYAQERGGRCLNESCDVVLEFVCKAGHVWRADVLKYTQQKWCRQCGHLRRLQFKDQLKKEQAETERKQAFLQEQLFQEARQKMEALNLLHNAAVLQNESDIEQSAKDMTRRFLSSSSEVWSFEQVHFVYKVLCSSEEFLKVKYFPESSGRDVVNKNYRKLARALHPDKNKHPFSGEAFQRLSSAYTAVIINLPN